MESEIKIIAYDAAEMMNGREQKANATSILISCHVLCDLFEWEPYEVEHLGYQHVMERFEQFKNEGWK